MNDAQMKDLVDIAASAMLEGAAAYMRANGRDPRAHADALTTSVREIAATALTAALNDARDAINIGMVDVGVATFVASMRLAGIAAAKRVLGEQEMARG